MSINKKLVLFGAGKIGRSFIGQLFSRGGYEVVFVDIYKPVIDELNKLKNYNVIIKSDKEEVLNIRNVRGVLVSDSEAVIREIATSDLLAVSIGQNGLPTIMPLIAKGLLARFQMTPYNPLDIIIAENLRNAAQYFQSELSKYIPEVFPLTELVGLVETSIGKMVPIMLQKDMEEDILQVFAEPYNNLILDKFGFKNPIPDINGLSPKKNMKAWVDRKLFIHNLGHAATAYLGFLYNPKFIYLYEALSVTEILNTVRETMLEAAVILLDLYPNEFSNESLIEHIDDLLYRFQNKALGDTIYRVGCDLKRKLSAEDRLAGAIHSALEKELPYNKILYTLICGCHFKAVNENGYKLNEDIEFEELYKRGLNIVLTQICGFDEIKHKELFESASIIDKTIFRNSFQMT